MANNFQELERRIPELKNLSGQGGALGFFAQEALRFYSVAGTLLDVKEFKLDETAVVDERYITHILIRSLLENYFKIIYIFDDPPKVSDRYEKLKNEVCEQYRKMMNDLSTPPWAKFMQTHGGGLAAVNPSWNKSNLMPNTHDMLLSVINNHGDRLNFLYPLFRIASFDTHGTNLSVLLTEGIGTSASFPVLKVRAAIEGIANEYLTILAKMQGSGAN